MTKKDYRNIIKWGKIKPFFKDRYKFNSIDIETINNELFIL
jgi:sulfur transfer protein SufE